MRTPLEEVVQLKEALVKADKEGDLERVMDALKALAAVENMTEAVVKKSKAGKALKDMKGIYEKKGEKEIAGTILDILKAWTKMAKQSAGKKAAGSAVGESRAATSSSAVAAPTLVPLGALAPHRRKIIDVMTASLKAKATGKSGTVDPHGIARAIENLINAKSPYDEDNFKNNAEYTSKVRTLVFNIKKNGDLANAIIDGTISPPELLSLTPDDLADEALVKKRRDIAELDANARRTDWLDVNKAKILANCGVEEDDNVMKLEEEVQSESDDDG